MIEFLIIMLLVLTNGVLAMSEIAVVSARRSRLEERAENGDSGASTALTLANDSPRFLSTIQIGISAVGVLAGAFGGATMAAPIAAFLKNVDGLAPYSDAIAVGIVVLFITYLSLVLGELVPKQIALNDPERVAAFVAPPMNFLSQVAAPAVQFLSLSTRLVVRILRLRRPVEAPVTDQEIEMLIDQGTQAGVFEPAEQELVKRVFRLGDTRIRALVTPRTEITALDVGDSPEEIKEKLQEGGHSRLPVVDGNMDNVIGMIKAEDLLRQILAGEPIDLQAVIETPLFIPENLPALDALEHFKRQHTHAAMVVDEYGGTLGMVTLSDILEAIVGNIAVTDEDGSQDLVQREDGSWLVDGTFPIQDLMDKMGVNEWEQDPSYQTLAGFILSSLGRMPSVGDHLERFGLRFEVVDMDGARIDRILVNRVQTSAEQPVSALTDD